MHESAKEIYNTTVWLFVTFTNVYSHLEMFTVKTVRVNKLDGLYYFIAKFKNKLFYYVS